MGAAENIEWKQRLAEKFLITVFFMMMIAIPFYAGREDGKIKVRGLQDLEKNTIAMYHRNV